MGTVGVPGPYPTALGWESSGGLPEDERGKEIRSCWTAYEMRLGWPGLCGSPDAFGPAGSLVFLVLCRDLRLAKRPLPGSHG